MPARRPGPEAIAEVICRESRRCSPWRRGDWPTVGAVPRSQLALMRSTTLMGWPLLASPAPSCAVGSTGSAGRAMNGSSTCVASIRRDPTGSASGADYSNAEVGHLARAGITDLWPRSSPETYADLVERVRNAQEEITVFGLARNFYAKDEILPLFESKAVAIPVTFFVMDPYCDSRRERYRLEPVEAAMEDPSRYMREVLRPLYAAAERVAPAASHRRVCGSTRTTFLVHLRLRRLTAHAGSCCTGMASEAPKVRSSSSMKARPTGTTSQASWSG